MAVLLMIGVLVCMNVTVATMRHVWTSQTAQQLPDQFFLTSRLKTYSIFSTSATSVFGADASELAVSLVLSPLGPCVTATCVPRGRR
jgi:hypothetical protein